VPGPEDWLAAATAAMDSVEAAAGGVAGGVLSLEDAAALAAIRQALTLVH